MEPPVPQTLLGHKVPRCHSSTWQRRRTVYVLPTIVDTYVQCNISPFLSEILHEVCKNPLS